MRGTVWALALLSLFCGSPTKASAQAQIPELTFRRLSTIKLGGLTLSELKITSVAVDQSKTVDGKPEYFVRLLVQDGQFSLASSDIKTADTGQVSGSAAVRGRFAGWLVGWATTEVANRDVITAMRFDTSAGSPGLRIKLIPSQPLRLPFLLSGSESMSHVAIQSEGPVRFDEKVAVGKLRLTYVSGSADAIQIAPGPGSPTQLWKAAFAMPATYTLDLASNTISPVNASVNLTLAANQTERFVVKASNGVSLAGIAAVRAATLVIAGTRADLTIRGLTLGSPTVQIDGESLPVSAVASATVQEIKTPFVRSSTGFESQAATVDGVRTLLDRDRLYELINDGTKAPEVLVPTGEPKLPYISSYTVRNIYSSLVAASSQPGRHHQVVLVQSSPLAIKESYHASEPVLSDEAKGYICVTLGYGAQAAITGLELANVVRTVLPYAFSAGLWGGVMLTPAATPFVFAGVLAVGTAGAWLGGEYMSNKLEEYTGVPNLPFLTPASLPGWAANKGVSKMCEIALGIGLEGYEGYPVDRLRRPPEDSKRLPTMPTPAPGASRDDVLKQRGNTIKKAAATWQRLSTADTNRLRTQTVCCDPRPIQAAANANATIWSEYAENQRQQLTTRQEAQEKTRREQWLAQQNANAAASNVQQRTYDEIVAEDHARMSKATGGSGGADFSFTLPLGAGAGPGGGGSGTSGSGGSCGACACSLTCWSTSVRPRR